MSGIASIFTGPPKPKTPVIPDPQRPPQVDESAVLAAKEQERLRRQGAGRSSTILTSGLSSPTTARSALLG